MRAVRILTVGMLLSASILGVRWVLQERGAPRGTPAVQVTTRPDEPGDVAPPPRPLSVGDPLPDADLIDQDGAAFRLQDLRGSALVLSFLYTHCDTPSMCPLTTARLARVHEEVERRDLQGVRFLIVSFDPDRDVPARLRAYAQVHGLDVPTFTFATGAPEEVGRLSRSFNTYYRRGPSGAFDHNIVVSVVDRRGVLRKEFFGTAWTASEIVSTLEGLAHAPDGAGPEGA